MHQQPVFSAQTFMVTRSGRPVRSSMHNWSQHEQIDYAIASWFLSIEQNEPKNLWSFCKAASMIVGTRNANQVRIYHKWIIRQSESAVEKFISAHADEFDLACKLKKPLLQKVARQFRQVLINEEQNESLSEISLNERIEREQEMGEEHQLMKESLASARKGKHCCPTSEDFNNQSMAM